MNLNFVEMPALYSYSSTKCNDEKNNYEEAIDGNKADRKAEIVHILQMSKNVEVCNTIMIANFDIF